MTALVSKQQILDAGTNGGFVQERGRHLRGTAPGDDVRDRGHTAGARAKGPADQRGGSRGN